VRLKEIDIGAIRKHMNMNFFTVSLEDNITTLLQSIPRIISCFDAITFTIVCPESSVATFKQSFSHFLNVKIKSETDILAYNDFRRIAVAFCEKTAREFQSDSRLGWYYQQVLKISYLCDNIEPNSAMVMWDADTIPTAKIRFFENGNAYLHGSLVEFHAPYFSTLKTIFGDLPPSYLAFTVQFFSATYDDVEYLRRALDKYVKQIDFDSNADWIAEIVIRSAYETHGTLDGSNFSEQELIGIACLKRTGASQSVIRYLRGGFEGVLNKFQLTLVRLCGFQHVTYENVSDLGRSRQGWLHLFSFLAKQLIRQRLFARLSRRNKESLAVHHH
jgi:hypothetical protein